MRQLALKLRMATIATYASYVTLLLGMSLWQLTREGGPLVTIWALQSLPLLICLPGMIRNNPRVYIWLCFIVIMYFLRGFLGVISAMPSWIDTLVLSMSVLLFIASMFNSRWLSMSIQQRSEAS